MEITVDLKRRERIITQLKDVMASAGVNVEDTDRGHYRSRISDWTWAKLAEDLAERIDRGKLG